MTIRFAAILGLALAGAAAAPAGAQPHPSTDRMRVTVRSALAGPICDRREVGACQSEARSRAIACDAFSDRLGCADTVIAAQSACLRATGCY
jgi:hypothetical protein